METRRLGRLGHESSVLVFGAAALAEVSQDVADEALDLALAAGINHLDVAADYGDAELRLGHRMRHIRDRVFLATKTGQRDRDAAWAQINRSLERLDTDHVDLLQLHAVCDLADLDRVTGPGGALEAAVRARDEGLVGGIGITGHTHDAPVVHAEALRRFDFDTVLTPLNVALDDRPGYRDAYEALVAAVRAADVGLMTIKAFARRNWPGERRLSTWYEPLTEQDHLTAACSWVLDGHPEVTGIATAGETGLLREMIAAERDRAGTTPERSREVLRAVEGYSSPFLAMPF
ncbi:aldo/keto reductase [Agilicoccus flavus]|uniref:aldo/keto reductase n=1 Tax=Agilicoccus flavus TaxID=2775968 RepID=UPI001CF61FFB|nr:aldo/keto reductase [Agilicoccus flavus]